MEDYNVKYFNHKPSVAFYPMLAINVETEMKLDSVIYKNQCVISIPIISDISKQIIFLT